MAGSVHTLIRKLHTKSLQLETSIKYLKNYNDSLEQWLTMLSG